LLRTARVSRLPGRVPIHPIGVVRFMAEQETKKQTSDFTYGTMGRDIPFNAEQATNILPFLLGLITGAGAAATAIWYFRDYLSEVLLENHHHRYTDEALEDLRWHTHFTVHELHHMYNSFTLKYPKGMSVADVTRELNLTDPEIAKRIFNAIDCDHNGIVDAKEWVSYLSCSLKGSPQEKVDFLFQVWDENNDGVISKRELTGILNHLIRTKQIMPRLQKQYKTPAEIANALAQIIIDDYDLHHDGKIHREEFPGVIAYVRGLHPVVDK